MCASVDSVVLPGTTEPLGGVPALVLKATALHAALHGRPLHWEQAISSHVRSKVKSVVKPVENRTKLSLAEGVKTDLGEWVRDARACIEHPGELPGRRISELMDVAATWIAPAPGEGRHRGATAEEAARRLDGADARVIRGRLLAAVAEGGPASLREKALDYLKALDPERARAVQPRTHPARPRVLVDADLPSPPFLAPTRERDRDKAAAAVRRLAADGGGIVAVISGPAMGRQSLGAAVLDELHDFEAVGWVEAATLGKNVGELAKAVDSQAAVAAQVIAEEAAWATLRNRLPELGPWCIAVDATGVRPGRALPRIPGGAWLLLVPRDADLPTSAERVELRPLPPAEILQLMEAVAGPGNLGADCAWRLANRVGGSPSLALHLARSVAGGHVTAEELLRDFRDHDDGKDLVPNLLRDTVAAQLQRLDPEQRAFVQRLSMLAPAPVPVELQAALDRSTGRAAVVARRRRTALAHFRQDRESLVIPRYMSSAIRAQQDDQQSDGSLADVVEAIAAQSPPFPAQETGIDRLAYVPHVFEVMPAAGRRSALVPSLTRAVRSCAEALRFRGQRGRALSLVGEALAAIDPEPATARDRADLEYLHAKIEREVRTAPEILEEADRALARLQLADGSVEQARARTVTGRIARDLGDLQRAFADLERAHRTTEQLRGDETGHEAARERAWAARFFAEVLQDRGDEESLSTALDVLVAAREVLLAGVPRDPVMALGLARVEAAVARARGHSAEALAVLGTPSSSVEPASLGDHRLVATLMTEAILKIDTGAQRQAVPVARAARSLAKEGLGEEAPLALSAYTVELEAELCAWQLFDRTRLRMKGLAALLDAPAPEPTRPIDAQWRHAIVACGEVLTGRTSVAHAAMSIRDAHDDVAQVRGEESQLALKLARLRWTVLAEDPAQWASVSGELVALEQRAASVGDGRHREAGLIALAAAKMAHAAGGDRRAARRLAGRAHAVLDEVVGARTPAVAAARGLGHELAG